MNRSIYRHFSKTVLDYDTTVDKVVQKNEELQSRIIDSINLNKNHKILDIGCGTGHGILLALKKFPQSYLAGIDFSNTMINKARLNLTNFKDRVNLIKGDFIKENLGKNYDVVMSGITIHNVTHKEKRILFKKIFNSLRKGGIFVNGDFIEGENKILNNNYRKIYRDFLRKKLKGNELKVWLHHAFKEDKPMKLSSQFKILRSIGFRSIDLIWQFNNEAVYIAKK